MNSKERQIDPPPAYDTTSLNLASAFSGPGPNASFSVPTPNECLAHLKLLEAFFLLREDISTTDGLYGIRDDFVPSIATKEQNEYILAKIREKRWAIYVTNASVRFEQWWRTSTEPEAGRKRKAAPLNFNQDNLPPLGELPS